MTHKTISKHTIQTVPATNTVRKKCSRCVKRTCTNHMVCTEQQDTQDIQPRYQDIRRRRKLMNICSAHIAYDATDTWFSQRMSTDTAHTIYKNANDATHATQATLSTYIFTFKNRVRPSSVRTSNLSSWMLAAACSSCSSAVPPMHFTKR